MPYNPFDLTKVWYKKDFPLIEVGYFELNRNPANYFADVEQAAFNPASVVPGISFSPDKMLQGRHFSYGDAPKESKVRHSGNCLKADPAYGKEVADALGISLNEAK